jgi:hypothetical protein
MSPLLDIPKGVWNVRLSSLRPRTRLLVELTLAAVFAAPVGIVTWPSPASFRSALPVVAWTVAVFAGVALIPLARYGRAIGKPLPFDEILDIGFLI